MLYQCSDVDLDWTKDPTPSTCFCQCACEVGQADEVGPESGSGEGSEARVSVPVREPPAFPAYYSTTVASSSSVCPLLASAFVSWFRACAVG